MSAQHAFETTENTTRDGLVRSLSHRQMTMIGLGSALGTGLFLGSASAISTAGPAVVVSYLLGALLIAVIATALGEMTAVHPIRGSFGAIARQYLGPWAGFVARWSYWAGAVIAIGGEVMAAALYLRFWWPQLPLAATIVVLACALVIINLVSVRAFGVTEFWLSGIKVTALVVFLLAGALLVFVGVPDQPAIGFGHLTEHGGFLPQGPASVWVALAVVMFAFVGFETVSISAAETPDPVRSIRTSTRALVWRLALFYVLAVGLVVTLSPWQEVASSDGDVESSPFVRVFASLGVPAAASVTNVIVLVAALSAANANLYGASRLMHSLAHDGAAPAPLAVLSRRGVPVRALLVSASGLLIAATLAATDVGNVFTLLVALATFAVLIVWAIILATYLVFRRRRGNLPAEPGYLRLWGGSVTAWLGIAGLLGVVATAFVVPDMQKAAATGLVFVVVLLAAHGTTTRRRRPLSSDSTSESP
ncbi:amino acid permease [Saccharopolyspora sp. NPDC002686]|uniref:amino acid permease n=1 Tax=Saccharopolyspora sp. NPDC002686 TaxID=3154541 RepID=UPI00332F7C68